MELYLIRHADALALGERGITDDADRPLSEVGEKQARALGNALQRHGLTFEKIVTSPYLRARQTADGMRAAWTTQLKLDVCDDLVPDGRPRKVARFLRDLGGNRIALVGHMPQL